MRRTRDHFNPNCVYGPENPAERVLFPSSEIKVGRGETQDGMRRASKPRRRPSPLQLASLTEPPPPELVYIRSNWLWLSEMGDGV